MYRNNFLGNNTSDIEASEELASEHVSSSNSNESYEDEFLEPHPNMKIPPHQSSTKTFLLNNFFDVDESAKVFKTPDRLSN